MSSAIKIYMQDAVAVVELSHRSDSNPMSEDKARAVIAACADLRENDDVNAVIFTGGRGRSFCSGGDFSEVSTFRGGAEVDNWIDWIVDLYTGVLAINKPTVAAIEGYAIGIGFQLALCCDWRVGNAQSVLSMPELAKGIGCTFGAAMLERALGRNLMTRIVFGCEDIDAQAALQIGLMDEIAADGDVLKSALARAQRLAGYPIVSMRGTKTAANLAYIAQLREVGAYSKKVHRAAFGAGGAQSHFQNILGRSKQATEA